MGNDKDTEGNPVFEKALDEESFAHAIGHVKQIFSS